MKFTINLLPAFLAAMILTPFAAEGGVEGVRRSDQDVLRLMAVNDSLIVPGDRAGQVFLGMTEVQLYQKMGNPTQNFVLDNGDSTLYVYRDLRVFVNVATHLVYQIVVDGPSFSTAQGISTGASELELKSKLGEPAWEILANNCSNGNVCVGNAATEVKLCYNSGLTVYANGGIVTSFYVFAGSCDE